MKIDVLGNPTGKKILLLPGKFCSWKIYYQRLIPILEKDYKVICITYTGFDKSAYPFDSVVNEMERIEDAIKEKCGGHIHLAYGPSIGARFLGMLVDRNRIKIDHMVIGSYTYPQKGKKSADFMADLMRDKFKSFLKEPEKKRGFIKSIMKKEVDWSEGIDDMMEDICLGLQKVDPDTFYNMLFTEATTTLSRKIGTPACTTHAFHSKKMGGLALGKCKSHFDNVDVHEFSMGPETWVLYPDVMKKEFEGFLGVNG